MTTGAKIQELRKKQNITQEQLADHLGVSRQSVSKWESGGAYPETDKLVRLGSLFHVSLDYLLRDDFEIAEPSTRRYDTVRFDTDTTVFALISGFGYVGGIALTYITVNAYVGFLTIVSFLFLSTILFLYRRAKYLSSSGSSDADRATLMKNTRILYSVDWMIGWLFLPLMIPVQVRIDMGFEGPFVEVEGIFAFGSYLILALMSGLLGWFLLKGVAYLHRESTLHRATGTFPTGILITDFVFSVIGGIALWLLLLVTGETDDYAVLVGVILVFAKLVVGPIVGIVKKRISRRNFVARIIAGVLSILAILQVIDPMVGRYVLALLIAGIALAVWLFISLEAILDAHRERNAEALIVFMGVLTTMVILLGILAFRWIAYAGDRVAPFWGKAIPIVLSLAMVFLYFPVDTLILKRSAKRIDVDSESAMK
ncbi:MAG: helix-turn-helix transcriptional regulator [Candidatus Izemoplasmatales bacterium]